MKYDGYLLDRFGEIQIILGFVHHTLLGMTLLRNKTGSHFFKVTNSSMLDNL